MQTSDLVPRCLDLSVAIQLWMIKINQMHSLSNHLSNWKKKTQKKVIEENVLKLFIYLYSNMTYNSKEDRLIFLKGQIFVQLTRKT